MEKLITIEEVCEYLLKYTMRGKDRDACVRLIRYMATCAVKEYLAKTNALDRLSDVIATETPRMSGDMAIVFREAMIPPEDSPF
jgi:hypothetical protein